MAEPLSEAFEVCLGLGFLKESLEQEGRGMLGLFLVVVEGLEERVRRLLLPGGHIVFVHIVGCPASQEGGKKHQRDAKARGRRAGA